MLCADGKMQQCFPIICAWTANYFENIHLHAITQPGCRMCEAPKSSFGEDKQCAWPHCDYQLYFRKLIQATHCNNQDQNDAHDYLMERCVVTMQCVFWNILYISLYILIVPDVLHTIHLGILKHLMEWIVPFWEFHKRIGQFKDLSEIMPHDSGFVRFNKPYTSMTQ
jgi:hypothetical protein